MKSVWSTATFVLAFAILITACGIGSSDEPSADDDELYQIGTLAALSVGGYDGLISLDELLDQGDFGLGTFDALDGEMVVLDGTVYRVPASGAAEEPDGDVTTPFAAVTTWDSDFRHEYPNPMSCADLEAAIDNLVDPTRPYALRVSGEFSTLLTRSEERQEPPYAPLADVLEGQIEFQLEQVAATMAGFRLPDYMEQSNSAGYHFHAITEDESTGGHVLDCQTSNVAIELDMIDSWRVDLTPK
jgi:acetolactate decarboxylase